MRTQGLIPLGLFLPTLLGAPVFAQEKTFFDAVEVKVATVEVVVEDPEGRKISGLTADDFEILEDGKRQELTYFSALQEGRPLPDGGLPGAAPSPVPGPVHLAIFVDDVHLAPQNRNQVIDRLKKYLETSFEPTDQVMIARLSDHLVIEQPFTADVAALEKTLDRMALNAGAALEIQATYRRLMRVMADTELSPDDDQLERTYGMQRPIKRRKSGPLESAGAQARIQAQQVLEFAEERRMRVVGTIQALKASIDSLAGLPGRKAMVYLSDGLPIHAAAGLVEAWRNKYESWARRSGSGALLIDLGRAATEAAAAEQELDELGQSASVSKVAFYVLSPGNTLSLGLGNFEMSGLGNSLTAYAAATERFENESSLRHLAEVTGGKVRLQDTDIGALLGEMRADFGTFYSLGYQPQVEAKDGNRRIVVQVRGQPDAKVRYTHHLGDQDPVERLRELTLSALYHGLADNPLRIELDPAPNPQAIGNDLFRVDVMVKVPFEKILLLPQEDHHVGRLTLLVVVRDRKNQNLSTMSRVEVPLKIPNDQLVQILAQKAAYPLKLEMQGGPQRLAIGMRDHLARVSSTIEVDFEVPDALAATILPPETPESPAPNNDGGV